MSDRVPTDVLRRALSDWLGSFKVRNAAIRAHVATGEALYLMRQSLAFPDLAPEAIEALAASFLRDRSVRMQIAKYMTRKYGASRADVMRDLGKFAELWREQVNKPAEVNDAPIEGVCQ